MVPSGTRRRLHQHRLVHVGVEGHARLGGHLLEAVALEHRAQLPARPAPRPRRAGPLRACGRLKARCMLSMTGSSDSTTPSAARRRSASLSRCTRLRKLSNSALRRCRWSRYSSRSASAWRVRDRASATAARPRGTPPAAAGRPGAGCFGASPATARAAAATVRLGGRRLVGLPCACASASSSASCRGDGHAHAAPLAVAATRVVSLLALSVICSVPVVVPCAGRRLSATTARAALPQLRRVRACAAPRRQAFLASTVFCAALTAIFLRLLLLGLGHRHLEDAVLVGGRMSSALTPCGKARLRWKEPKRRSTR